MVGYVARIADQELEARLRVTGAVLIEGSEACGKTATASQVANTIIRFDEDPVTRAQVELDHTHPENANRSTASGTRH